MSSDKGSSARWQHVVLFATSVGALSGGIMFVIAVTGSGSSKAAPWWVGVIVLMCSACVAALATVSLRAAMRRDAFAALLRHGLFELRTSSEAMARLNARLVRHFRMAPVVKSPMPLTCRELVARTAELANEGAILTPAQLDKARLALAAVTGREPQTILWSDSPIEVVSARPDCYHTWQRLRAQLPGLPNATLNKWIETIAIYIFLAGLIAIAVPIAQRLDSNKATQVQTTPLTFVTGKAIGIVVFGAAIAILMVPVYVVGRRVATCLPPDMDDLGQLAWFGTVEDDDSEWTVAIIEEHVLDLASAELGVPASTLVPNCPLKA